MFDPNTLPRDAVEAYCREISSWIDPHVVTNVIQRLNDDREAAFTPSGCVVVSNELRSAEEAGFASLARLYLEHFRFPAGYLDLLADSVDASVRSWFEALRFEGSIVLNPQIENPPQPDVRGLLFVHERDVVADLLIQPLNMLLSIVTTFAYTWRNPPLSDVYLLHSSTGPFHTFVERVVAESFGFEGCGAGGVVAAFQPERVIGTLTFTVKALPLDSKGIEILRSAATEAMTWH